MQAQHYILYITLSLLTIKLSAQSDSIGVYIPKDDASPSSTPKKNMYVNYLNNISSTYLGDWEFVKVVTDNGSVLKIKEEFENYYIAPSHPGKVTVQTIMKIWTGRKYDTIKTCNEFIAIKQPKVVTILDEQYLKDSSDIRYYFVEKKTKKENPRYQLGTIPAAINVFKGRRCIGTIDFFTPIEEIKPYLVKGNILHFPSFNIRDMETDLLSRTPEFNYKIRKTVIK